MNGETSKPHLWTRLLNRPGWLTVLAVCLLILAVLVPFGWRYYRTQQLVAGIEAHGGLVSFEAGGPGWLRNIVGDEWMEPFDTPVGVRWRHGLAYIVGSLPPVEKLTDAVFFRYIVQLDELHGIRSFEIGANDLTQRSLEKLAQFEHLKVLFLWNETFDDEVLAHFSKAHNLRVLDLSGTSVTDEGLRHLQGLKNLESLSLSNTDVTDEGVSELQRHLPGLDVSDD